MTTKKRNNLVLLTLILTFTLPLLLAGFLYWTGLSLSSKTTNYGQLIQPSISIKTLAPFDSNNQALPEKDILGRWVLLTVSPARCEKACQKSLYEIRQICKATGKDHTRLRQVVLKDDHSSEDTTLQQLLKKEYPQTSVWKMDKERIREFTQLPADQKLDNEEGAIYFIDPQGNIMMRYPATANPSGIFKDLTKLLKISQIG